MRGINSDIVFKLVFYYLDFGQDGHDGHDDAEDEVEADEDFVLRAVVGFGVINVENHDEAERQGVEDDGDREQSCGKHQ